MASAHTLPIGLDRAFRTGFFHVADPGDGKKIDWHNKGFVIVPITTAGAETRLLPPANAYGVGTTMLVYGKTLAGTATITGVADSGSVVLTNAGDVATFVCVEGASGREWSLTSYAIDATDLGTVEIDTGDSGSDDAIVALFNALKARNLVSGTWTAAST